MMSEFIIQHKASFVQVFIKKKTDQFYLTGFLHSILSNYSIFTGVTAVLPEEPGLPAQAWPVPPAAGYCPL